MEELHHEIHNLRAQVAASQQENLELKSFISRQVHDDDDDGSKGMTRKTPPAPSTAFYELSTELLDMIVEASSGTMWSVSPMIWRLVHPRFSYLDSIMEPLFQEVSLQPGIHASQRDLRVLEALAPYARRVRFIQAYVHRLSCGEEELYPRETTSARTDRIYEENSDLLQSYRVHVESGAQQDYFVEALKTLNKVRSVTMSYDEPVLWNALTYPRDDQAYVLTIECLRRAGTCIKDLYLELNASATIDSHSLCSSATWQSWDLTALQKLRIKGYESSEEAPMDRTGPECPELQHISTKCSSSLVDLKLDDCGTLFQLPLEICMPQLRRLRLATVQLGVSKSPPGSLACGNSRLWR